MNDLLIDEAHTRALQPCYRCHCLLLQPLPAVAGRRIAWRALRLKPRRTHSMMRGLQRLRTELDRRYGL